MLSFHQQTGQPDNRDAEIYDFDEWGLNSSIGKIYYYSLNSAKTVDPPSVYVPLYNGILLSNKKVLKNNKGNFT